MGRLLPGFAVALIVSGLLLPIAMADEAREERLVSFLDDAPLEGTALPGGARVVESFSFAGIALVEGTPLELTALHRVAGVAGVYEPEPVQLNLDRSRDVVRAEPPTDAAGAAAWPTGAGTTIAVVDSGVDATHPAFDGRIAKSVRVTRGGVTDGAGDDDGHGTHIAGILAGDGAGSRDGRHHGLAPGARLVAVDISDAFTTTTAVRAFEWIHDNRHEYDIRVVSNSWGREKEDAHYDPNDPVIRASDALVEDGLVVVFSAGNRGRDGAQTLTTEAQNPNVLTVGAASASGRPDAYSSRGPARDSAGATLEWVKPDVVAPGTGIVSTRTSTHAPANARSDEERYYVVMNGTSMAAPHVAAAAALMIDAEPTLTPGLVAAILTGTARDVGARGADPDTGHGMLDVRAAIDAASGLDAQTRSVPIERSVPLRAQGSLTALVGQVVLVDDAPELPPEDAVRLPFAFPEGAKRVDLHLNWSGPGTLVAELHGPLGRVASFEPARAGSLRLEHAVDAGAHAVIVRASGPATSTPFVLDGELVLVEEQVMEVPAEFTARGYSGSGGFFETRTGISALLDVPTSPLALALMASVASLAGAAAWLRLRKRA